MTSLRKERAPLGRRPGAERPALGDDAPEPRSALAVLLNRGMVTVGVALSTLPGWWCGGGCGAGPVRSAIADSERSSAGTAWANASRQSRIGSPDGSGVGARTAHAGGVEARCHVLPGTSTTSTSMRVARSTSRAQSARDARPPLTRWWNARASPVAGTARPRRSAPRSPRRRRARRSGCRSRRRPPAAARPPRFARSAAAAILAGKSLPGGPWSHEVRTIARRPSAVLAPSAWLASRSALRLRRAVGVDRVPPVVRARSPGRRSAGPSNTSLVEIDQRGPDPARRRMRSAMSRPPSPLRRIASAGSLAQPSTSVQAAAWMTTSGRSRSSSARHGVAR